MSPLTLTDLELKWLIKKTGVQGPRDDLKRRYFKSQGAVGFSIGALEQDWLCIAIVAALGTPTSSYPADLWAQLVGLLGYRVSKNINENKRTFYTLN